MSFICEPLAADRHLSVPIRRATAGIKPPQSALFGYASWFASSRSFDGLDDVQLIEAGQKTSLPMVARTCGSLSLYIHRS